MKWAGLAFGLLLMGAWGASVNRERVILGQNDFLQFYCGAVLSGGPDLHSADATARVQNRIAEIALPAVTFARPDYYAILLKPLAWLSFPAAYATFQLLNLFALGAFLWMFKECEAIRWLAAVSIPLLTSFINGQDVPLILAIFAVSVWLERRGSPFWAGVALGFCTIKFHLFLFVPIALLIWRKWRVVGGAAASAGALSILAGAVRGWNWPIEYLRILQNPGLHPEPFQFMNARGLAIAIGQGHGIGLWAVTAAAALAICVCLFLSRGATYRTTLAVSLAGGLLVSYHLGIHDCSLLLAVVALSDDEWLRRGAAILSIPVPYYLLMLDGMAGAIPALALTSLMLAVTWRSFRRLPRASAG